MPGTAHDTTALPALPSRFPVTQQWERAVLPRLPEGWQEQAKALGALQRRREISEPGDLLRGLLASQLFGYSFRQVGAWSVLADVADLSDTAWRKRLRQAGPWLEWMVQRKLAIQTAQMPWLLSKGLRRVILVDGTHLRCLGKQGETWRIHTA